MGISRIKVGLVVALPLIFSSLFLLHFRKEQPDDALNMSTPQQQQQPPSGTTMEVFGVTIERNPPESKLTHLAVTSWPKWGCSPSKFPWTFTAKETMYLLEGKVKVYVEGHEGSFEIGAGDLVEFPKGMKVTWDVLEAVNKHYNLDNS